MTTLNRAFEWIETHDHPFIALDYMKTTLPTIYTSPELEQLRQLVAGARARLAELEADFTKEKSRVDALQAVLFLLLREHYHKRDRLRLKVEYRRKFLNSLKRGDSKGAKQEDQNYKQAKAQTDRDYEELAAAADTRKPLTANEEAELTQLWKKLVKLYHPDRYANQPEELETYHKLTSAINQAKDNGDIELLREIAEDPQGFLMRQGWATLDFGDAAELAQLRKLHETLTEEIGVVADSLRRLRESPDYELCQLSEQKPGTLEELAVERIKQVETEIAELEKQAEQLANEIKILRNKTPSMPTGIVAKPQANLEPRLEKALLRRYGELEGWPCLSAFCRLALLLGYYAVVSLLGLFVVGCLLVFSCSIGLRLATAFGGSWLASVAGYAIAFVIMLLSQVVLGFSLGWLIAVVMERWPSNPIARLVQWVQNGERSEGPL